jgi:flagellar basal body rod protein FlgG
MAEGLPDANYTENGSRLGVAVTERDLVMETGTPVETLDPLNFAITDDAFYRVTTPSGDTAYTRTGNLSVDGAGQVTLFNQQIDPPITVPAGAHTPVISADGRVTATTAEGGSIEIGQVQLTRFSNAKGLRDIGGGLYTESANSGATVQGRPGDGEFAPLLTGYLEGSNVDVADELTQMMIAQRIYTANAKSFSIGDDMLRIATNLTR